MTWFFTRVGTLNCSLGRNHPTPQSMWASARTVVGISRTGLASDKRSATNSVRKSCLKHEETRRHWSPPATSRSSMLISYSSLGRTGESPINRSTLGTLLREKSTSRCCSTSSSSCRVCWHLRQSRSDECRVLLPTTHLSCRHQRRWLRSFWIYNSSCGSTWAVALLTCNDACCFFWEYTNWSYVIGSCCLW